MCHMFVISSGFLSSLKKNLLQNILNENAIIPRNSIWKKEPRD